jgi:general stress protein YciG
MAVSFQFKSNSKQVNAKLSQLVAREIPFATAVALTRTAQTLKEQNERDMPTIFQNPSRWTRGAFRVIPAKKNNPRAFVARKDKVTGTATNVAPNRQQYLEVQQDGGGRKPKAFETAIRTRGKGTGNFRYATPTRDTRLNASGNMTRASVNKMLGEIGKKGGKFFVPKSTHPLALRGGDGVFERMAKNKVKKRLHLFNTMPTYRPQFRFFKRMTRYGKTAFPRIFRVELRNALRTSRFR